MKWLSRSLFVLSAVLLAHCASQPKQVSAEEPEKLDRTFTSGTGTKNEQVGEKGGSIVIQKKVSLEQDLAATRDSIEELEHSLYGVSRKDPGGLWLRLKECRARLADPRLGGNGVPEAMESWEKLSESETDTKYRVEDKKYVVAVSEEQLEDRLSKTRNTKAILERRFGEFSDKLERCDERYRSTLVKNGLDPEDTKAEGEWVDGPNGYRVWKVRRSPTNSPEELMRRKEEREKKRKEEN